VQELRLSLTATDILSTPSCPLFEAGFRNLFGAFLATFTETDHLTLIVNKTGITASTTSTVNPNGDLRTRIIDFLIDAWGELVNMSAWAKAVSFTQPAVRIVQSLHLASTPPSKIVSLISIEHRPPHEAIADVYCSHCGNPHPHFKPPRISNDEQSVIIHGSSTSSRFADHGNNILQARLIQEIDIAQRAMLLQTSPTSSAAAEA